MGSNYPQTASPSRWLLGLAGSVFMAGVLFATICSTSCIGMTHASPAEAPQPTESHHAGHQSAPATPADTHHAPEDSDCSAHGHNTEFLAAKFADAAKLRADSAMHAAITSAPAPLVVTGGNRAFPPGPASASPLLFYSHQAFPLRI